MMIGVSDQRSGGREPEDDIEGKLLRLECPFCGAEYPLWFRADDADDTLSATEWERWLGTRCTHCGRTPREHIEATEGQ